VVVVSYSRPGKSEKREMKCERVAPHLEKERARRANDEKVHVDSDDRWIDCHLSFIRSFQSTALTIFSRSLAPTLSIASTKKEQLFLHLTLPLSIKHQTAIPLLDGYGTANTSLVSHHSRTASCPTRAAHNQDSRFNYTNTHHTLHPLCLPLSLSLPHSKLQLQLQALVCGVPVQTTHPSHHLTPHTSPTTHPRLHSSHHLFLSTLSWAHDFPPSRSRHPPASSPPVVHAALTKACNVLNTTTQCAFISLALITPSVPPSSLLRPLALVPVSRHSVTRASRATPTRSILEMPIAHQRTRWARRLHASFALHPCICILHPAACSASRPTAQVPPRLAAWRAGASSSCWHISMNPPFCSISFFVSSSLLTPSGAQHEPIASPIPCS